MDKMPITKIHDAVRDLLQKFEEEEGIRVNSISVLWIDVSDTGKMKYILKNISMNTTKGV